MQKTGSPSYGFHQVDLRQTATRFPSLTMRGAGVRYAGSRALRNTRSPTRAEGSSRRGRNTAEEEEEDSMAFSATQCHPNSTHNPFQQEGKYMKRLLVGGPELLCTRRVFGAGQKHPRRDRRAARDLIVRPTSRSTLSPHQVLYQSQGRYSTENSISDVDVERSRRTPRYWHHNRSQPVLLDYLLS